MIKNKKIKEFLLMNLGTVLMGFAIYFFKFPNNFSTGGVSGISTLLSPFIAGMSPGLIMMIINVLLLGVGFILIGHDFTFKTVYCSLLLSGVTYVMEFIVPMPHPFTNDKLLELVFAIFMTGAGSAILFNIGASTGGTDIVAMIIKKYTQMNISKALFYADIVIVALSFVVFGIQTWLYSVLGFLCKVFVVNNVIESFNESKYFTIVTEKASEIGEYITTELRRGATMSRKFEGVYSNNSKTLMLTVVRRNQAIKLRNYIKQIDPHAFVIVSNTSDIIGRGFRELV